MGRDWWDIPEDRDTTEELKEVIDLMAQGQGEGQEEYSTDEAIAKAEEDRWWLEEEENAGDERPTPN